ncbi:TPA: hypothetical protein DEB00_00380 [Candidatus Uhrbacteria bacterium]|nr:hypothetical protein [Candidatus Uhrbacteria bacterium]
MMLYYLGTLYEVSPYRKFDERYIWFEQGSCFVSMPQGDVQQIRHLVNKWVEREAKVYLTQRVRQLSQETDWHVHRVSFRRQSTIWGSCSSQKNLSLNLQLIHLDPALIDYVLIHELAHTREMNHSRAFWHLVAQHCPDYPQIKRALLDAHRTIKEHAR